jgi:hypothetical protein
MKFAADRPYADPEAAARKLIEVANSSLAELGHSQMQKRPPNSATPMSQAGETVPELGFSLNPWPGRRPQQLLRKAERLR